MRKGWTYRRIGDVCTVIGGATPKTEVKEFWGGKNYWITPADLDGRKYQGATPRTITDAAVEKTNLQLLPVGTVLLSSRAPIGKVAITTVPMYCNQGFKNIICPDSLLNEFVYWFLFYNKDYLNSLGTGATFKEISKKTTESVLLPVPPLAEQERIVAELDLLQGIIDKQKAQLKELDTLAQSIFYDMFGDPVENEKGWEVKLMGEVGTLQRGSGLSKQDLIDDGYPCILYGQIHTRFGAFTDHHIACIPDELVHTAKIARTGDVIMAITSEDVEGSCKSTAWLGDYDVAIGSDAAIYRHTLNGIYVSYYTRTQAFFNEKAKYAHGFKVTHISTKEIATIPILVPPSQLQELFAEKVVTIERQKASINASIAETQKLFDYTMDKYFG